MILYMWMEEINTNLKSNKEQKNDRQNGSTNGIFRCI